MIEFPVKVTVSVPTIQSHCNIPHSILCLCFSCLITFDKGITAKNVDIGTFTDIITFTP